MPKFGNEVPRRQPRPNTNSNKKPYTNKLSETALPTSLSKCKKQHRDATRLLSRGNLPSTKTVELERRIKMLSVMMEQLSSSQVIRKNARRYHKVKFIERKKILRSLTKLEKQAVDSNESETAEYEAKKHSLLVCLNYATYYPDTQKYISLYPSDPSKTPKDVAEKQERIKRCIIQAMEDGDLPLDARDIDPNDQKRIKSANKALVRSLNIATKIKPGSHNNKNDNKLSGEELSSDDDDADDADEGGNRDNSSNELSNEGEEEDELFGSI